MRHASSALLAGAATLASVLVYAQSAVPPDPLTIEWVVQAVRRQHPALTAAAARARAAAEQEEQAWALPDPMLMAEAEPAYRFGDGLGMTMLMLRQDLPLGPQRRLRAQAARADARAARSEAKSTELDLVLQARLSFVRLAEAQAVRDAREEEVVLAHAAGEVVRARVTAGGAPPSTAVQVAFVATEAETSLVSARAEEEAARQALAALMGRLARDLPVRVSQLAVPPNPAPAAELMERAARSRPEVRTLDARARASHKRASAARAGAAPMLSVGAGYMLDFMEPDGIAATLGVSLPIWTGPRAAEAQEATEIARALEADAASVLRQIAMQIGTTRAALVGAIERARIVRERLIPQAQAHHELASIEFAQGQTNMFGLLDALQHHVRSRLLEATTVAEAVRLSVSLDRIAGR